jgi:hypothetical protein
MMSSFVKTPIMNSPMGKNLMQVCTSLRNKEYYAISDDEMAS